MHSQNIPGLFQMFLEYAPTAIAMFDREMRYVATSRRWLTEYNLGKESLIGRYHYEVFPEIADKWKKIHQHCLAGEVESCEADSFVRADGSVDWVKWESRPWYDHDGKIGGIVIFSEVITERKIAEEALDKSKARFQKLAANLPVIIFQFILHTDGTVSLPYVSPGCYQVLKLKPEELQHSGKFLREVLHPDDYQSFKESIAISADTLLPWLWEGRVITPCGKLKWVRAISRPEKQVNGDILWDGLVIDISDRVQAQEQLQQYQEHLEIKVEERTRLYAKANKQLQAEIVERKLAEKALRKSEARLKNLARCVCNIKFVSRLYQFM